MSSLMACSGWHLRGSDAQINTSDLLGEERWQSRTASLSTQGLAAETELSLSLPYRILQKQPNSQQVDTHY